MILPAAEWMPDAPSLSNPGINTARNVIPRSPTSYGPFSGLSAFSTTALGGPCLGAIGAQDSSGATYVFAGTADKLAKLAGGSTAWDDVSDAGGYSAAAGERWRFTQFKNTIVATDYSDDVQAFVLGSGATAFSQLSAGAPRARYAAVIKSFLMLGNTSDPVGGTLPERVWWSAENDPTNWPTPGSAAAQQVMSDYNDIVGPQGAITGIVSNLANADGAIFFARGIYRVVWAGPPSVFNFLPAEGVRGTRSPDSIVQIGGGMVPYLGDDGFYSFDGAFSQPIGLNKVDKWFFANVNQGYLENIIGASDATGKVAMWLFPSSGNGTGIPDMAIMWHWGLNRWSVADLPAQWVFRMLSFGTALDTLPSLGYTTIESVPFSLDSRVWQGGQLLLGAIDTSGKLAYFNGSNLAAQIGTTELQPAPLLRAWINSSRPLVDGSTRATVSLGIRARLGDSVSWGLDVAQTALGECPQRADARYAQALVKVPAGEAWTHAEGVEIEAAQGGVR